jgi:hypothetical protein
MRRRRLLCLLVCASCLVFAATASSATRLPGFRSPSGNIACLLVSGPTLRCDIGHSNYSKTLQTQCMSRASIDWHGFELGRTTKGAVTCSGGILYNPGTQSPAYVKLSYGKNWRQGAFTCQSRRDGVTCRNASGHGLFISRQSWRTW